MSQEVTHDPGNSEQPNAQNASNPINLTGMENNLDQNIRSRAGRPRIDSSTPIQLKNYFSINTAAQILLNSNYIHKSSILLKSIETKKKMTPTTTFCFYNNFYKDGNYPQLLQSIKQLCKQQKDIEKSLKSLNVTMPSFVFDQYSKLVLKIVYELRQLYKNNNNNISSDKQKQIIKNKILVNIKQYPYLTFRKVDVLKKFGFQLVDFQKMQQYNEAWISSLVNIIQCELNRTDSQLFEQEYKISQKIKTTISWQNKQQDIPLDNVGKRKKQTKEKEEQDQDQDQISEEKDTKKQKKKI